MRFLWLVCALACGDTGGDSGGGTTTTPPPTGSCRETADCPGAYCFSPGEPNCPLEQSCNGVTCPTGESCLPADPAFDSCADSVCRPDCADDLSCRDGEFCDPSSAHCTPIPCSSGFLCAAHESCVPGEALHGCVRAVCAADAECGGGFCVKGACYGDLGACGMQAEN
jgi:hypothetical protein